MPLDGIAAAADGLNGDIHASAEYRAHLIGVMAKRAVGGRPGLTPTMRLAARAAGRLGLQRGRARRRPAPASFRLAATGGFSTTPAGSRSLA